MSEKRYFGSALLFGITCMVLKEHWDSNGVGCERVAPLSAFTKHAEYYLTYKAC